MLTLKTSTLNNELLPNLFRQEYGKMTAVLCRHFGLKHIEEAEDIASDIFLKASEHWALNGIPDNPTAWLYTAAKNKTKDYLKHTAIFESRIKQEISREAASEVIEAELNPQDLSDSQLEMMFAVCDPAISAEAQICLILKILCGFSVEAIANAFLIRTETIKKRLHRAKATLRNNNFTINAVAGPAMSARLTVVLKALYLLFNEGYYSRTSNQVIRKELCLEALRLTVLLTEHEMTNTPKTNALLALICYQSSRLDARTNSKGEMILFEEQDRSLWDTSLIDRGNYYIVNATSGNQVSSYHLQAAVAYWHTATTNDNKWEQILVLYNQLILIEYSPVTALNRAYAIGRVHGNEKGIHEAEKLNLTDNCYYHALLANLYRSTNIPKAIHHYERAMTLSKSKSEKQTLKKQAAQLRTNLNNRPGSEV